jgi:hypothetical protein
VCDREIEYGSVRVCACVCVCVCIFEREIEGKILRTYNYQQSDMLIYTKPRHWK